ncbi:MAG: recombinase family protein, partial [Neisseria sp.]|nr:recombinase family protein [Neisseria sp.]
ILAEEYSRELSKKINNAHRNRQKNGGSVILTSNAYGFKKLPDKSVVLIEEEAQVKRRMYQLCADGYGSRTIANILSNEGVKKKRRRRPRKKKTEQGQ